MERILSGNKVKKWQTINHISFGNNTNKNKEDLLGTCNKTDLPSLSCENPESPKKEDHTDNKNLAKTLMVKLRQTNFVLGSAPQ